MDFQMYMIVCLSNTVKILVIYLNHISNLKKNHSGKRLLNTLIQFSGS